MDGVPWLTQKPIMAGETFVYEFTCPDAGSFWYHPHVNSLE
jgi:FtsP/CotA-like multicopper oxidase with cupredoxin domain